MSVFHSQHKLKALTPWMIVFVVGLLIFLVPLFTLMF